MKNLTNHFIDRWVERVVGITTTREKNEYIEKNREQIIEHANKTFEYAEHIYKGQIGSNITRNFYIKDGLIFVTNTDNNAFVTVYKFDLGFSDKLNNTIRVELMNEINELKKEKEKVELASQRDMGNLKNEVAMMRDQIEILQEQINNTKQLKKFKQEEINHLKKSSLNISLDIKHRALTLVNSKEYREDLQSIK